MYKTSHDFSKMETLGNKFCSNSYSSGGLWTMFYQAPENVAWKSVSLTHVDYPEGDIIGKFLAWASLLPIFLVVSFVTLILFRREIHTITFFSGILMNEGINQILKYIIKAPRPCRNSDAGHVIYGMPSSHSQFMSFFASYITLFALIRLHTQYESITDIIWKHVISIGSILASIIVAYSRVYLRYHTPEQVICGLIIGSCLGISWFICTQRIFSQFFDDIVSWPVSEFFLIKDSSRIPNVLWFEYVESRKESRQRQRKSTKSQ